MSGLLAVGQVAADMQVETVIRYGQDIVPRQFDTDNRVMSAAERTAMEENIFADIASKISQALLDVDMPQADVDLVDVRDFTITEHFNAMDTYRANLASVSARLVSTGRSLSAEFDKYTDGFATYLSRAEGNENYSFLQDATSTDRMLADPCNSPFQNDCDVNAVCTSSEMTNAWRYGLKDGPPSSNPVRQYSAFYNCECRDGWINQRLYDDVQSTSWRVRGSVCVENKFRDDRIFEQAMKGGIAMVVYLFVVIILFVWMCIWSRKFRSPVCGIKCCR